MLRRIIVLLVAFLTVGVSARAQSTAFTYQGRLTDGGLQPTGSYDLEFRLFDALEGGNQQPPGTPITITLSGSQVVSVANGIFTVQLDFGGATAFDGNPRWLQIAVKKPTDSSFAPLTPRQPVSSTPYAIKSLNAVSAETATNSSQLNGVAASQYVQTTDPRMSDARAPTVGSVNYIQNNPASQQAGNFNLSGNGVIGNLTVENKWRAETTTINSVAAPVPGPPNLIGGFLGTGSGGALPGNRVTPGVVGATIGGGGFDGLIYFGFLPYEGDFSNRVTDWFGTVGGGYWNRAGNDTGTVDDALFATVGGGESNTASANFATVGGGAVNNASGDYATVGGGTFNTASGPSATVGGGQSNTASGYVSFAAGNRAKANHQGTFVWADSTNTDFASTANDQFLIRANGGVGIGTNTPGSKLHVNVPSSTSPISAVSIDVESFSTPGNAQNSHFFRVRDTAANIGSAFLIRGDGNVGIGTDSPGRKLDIVAATVEDGIRVSGTTSGAISPAISLYDSGNQRSVLGLAELAGHFSTSSAVGDTVLRAITGKLILQTGPTSGSLIINSGSVGIGITPDTANKLQVNGLISTQLASNGSENVCRNILAQLATCSSSLRYKTNVNHYSSGLSLIRRLAPITFNWKQGGMKDLGLGAEDVAQVEPLLVTYDSAGAVQGVKYDRVGVVLINAVQEQQAEIEQQRSVIERQQQQINAIRKLFCSLKANAQICKDKE